MARPTTLRESRGAIRRILRYARPHLRGQRMLMAGGLLALLAEVAFRVLEPWPVKIMIDAVTVALGADLPGNSGPTASVVLLAACGLAVVTLAGGRALMSYLSTVGFALVGSRVATSIRADVHSHAQNLSVQYHKKASRGDLVQRLISDVGRLQEVATTAGLPLVGNIITLFVMTGVMLWIDPLLTAAVALAGLAFVITSRHTAPKVTAAARSARDSEGELAGTASENFGAIAVVQAYGLQEQFGDRFAASNNKSLNSGVKSRRLSAALERSTDVVVGIATGAVLAFGGWRVMQGEMTPGDLVLFLTYLKTALKPLRDLAKYTGRIARAAASGERILDVLDVEPEIVDRPGATDLPARTGLVEICSVTAGYPGTDVLRGLTTTLRPGERVALVGPSGAGKSTVVGTMLRQQDPTNGAIFLDGIDLRDYTARALRASMAVVLQESVLFATSVLENIRMGRPDAADSEVEYAARVAGAHDFICRLPQGYRTHLGERGDTLSGGQRQRIALARALLRDPPLMILDEPTTGLDDAMAQEVRDGIMRTTQGRTTLIVTHDLDTALGCDRVLWLADGRIVEDGSPEELIARGGPAGGWLTEQRLLTEQRHLTEQRLPTEQPPADQLTRTSPMEKVVTR